MKQTVGFNPFPRKISQAEIDSHFKEENALFKTKVAAGEIQENNSNDRHCKSHLR
jgi:hypothetical protein